MEELNKEYKVLLKAKKISSFGLNLIAVSIILLIIGFAGVSILKWIGAGCLIVGIILFLANNNDEEFKAFQENLTEKILSRKFNLIEYSKKNHLNPAELTEAGICSTLDDIKPNDYIEAEYKGVHFIAGDTISFHEEESYDSDSGRNTVEVVTFKGLVFKLRNSVSIDGPINIKEKGAKLFRKDIIKTGNSSFDKRYRIYSFMEESSVIGIINDKIIEALTNLDEYAGKKNTLFAYFNGQDVIIGLHNFKDLFESTPRNIEKTIVSYEKDADFIAGALDIIKSSGIIFE